MSANADSSGLAGVAAGNLAVGHAADVCIFDPSAWWKVERGALSSQGKNTPFLGLEVQGRVRYTLVGGKIEGLIADLLGKALRAEHHVGVEYLAAAPPR